MRCLIIQLSPLSETLQSLMALRASQQLYPKLEFYFLVRQSLAHNLKHVTWLKNVIAFPTEILSTALESEEKNLEHAKKWMDSLSETPWDLVVNWTFSEPSSYLNALVSGKVKLGYTRSKDATFESTDGWSHYMKAIIQEKIPQNIHITDLLTTQLLTALHMRLGEPQTTKNSVASSFFSITLPKKAFFDFPRHQRKKWIALQIGENKPIWNIQNWTKIAKWISNHRDYGICLLGGKKDIPLEEAFLKEFGAFENDAFLSFVGELSFDLWTAVLSRSECFISSDTASIQLASILGVQVIHLAFDCINFEEVGPYGNGHYVISTETACSEVHTCAEKITAETVYATWSYHFFQNLSLEAHFENLYYHEHLKDIKIFRSKLRSVQEGGGVFFEPLISRNFTLKQWSTLVTGQIARSWYCGWTAPLGQEIPTHLISPPLIQELRKLEEATGILLKIFHQASTTAFLIHQKGTSLKSEMIMSLPDKLTLQKFSEELLALERLMDQLAHNHPTLLLFTHMRKVLMHHLKGSTISELSEQTFTCYQQLKEGAQLLHTWIHFTLNVKKPHMLPRISHQEIPLEVR